MTTQLIEGVTIFEVTVKEDTSTTHLMSPPSDQWVKLSEWFGNMKLIHQIALNTFNNSNTNDAASSPDSTLGRVVASIAGSPTLTSKLPVSAIGNKLNELVQWISEGHNDCEEDDEQRIVISGSDLTVKPNGAIWLAGLGDTSVVLTADQINRVPVSVELLDNPIADMDTVAMVINYRDEFPVERHLTLV